MGNKKNLSDRFGIAAIAAAVLAVCLCITGSVTQPVLLSSDSGPQSAVSELFDAVCAADYGAVSASLCGQPSLGIDGEASSEMGRLILDAYRQSCSYELDGGCKVTGSGLTQSVKFTSLDIKALTQALNERAPELLSERVAKAKNVSEVYEDDGSYREDFVMDVLADAVRELLKNDAPHSTVTLEVALVYTDGRWQPVADDALLNVIAGGTLY